MHAKTSLEHKIKVIKENTCEMFYIFFGTSYKQISDFHGSQTLSLW